MAGGKRPGGLTALAVLNFVWGGLSAIGLLIAWGGVALAQKLITEAEKGGAVYKGPSIGMIYIGLIISTITMILLIVSGVGYLGLKKFLGRTLGNLYAVLSLGGAIFGIVVQKSGFGFFTILFMIYPLLTLILLNTTFKEDFVN